jgi:hypothetical protein
LDVLLESANSALIRRLWMGLHLAEREHDEQVPRRELARLVSSAFVRGVPDALQHWEDGSDQGALDAQRQNRACDLFADEGGGLPAMLRTRVDPETLMAAYRKLAAHRWGPGWADMVCPEQMVREWIENVYAAMAEHDEDPEDDDQPGGDRP